MITHEYMHDRSSGHKGEGPHSSQIEPEKLLVQMHAPPTGVKKETQKVSLDARWDVQ